MTDFFDWIEHFDAPISKIHVAHPNQIQIDMLRLDQMHPTLSGNKCYKLFYNLQDAIANGKNEILSFGGAFSNHLHALAYAGKLLHLKTIGIVRGDACENPTLQDCSAWGMDLHFVTREAYRQKSSTAFLEEMHQQFPNACIIPEGGDNDLGRKGSALILGKSHLDYDVIACSVGTGTTFSGIINSSLPNQKVLGFAALKNADYLNAEIAKHTNKQNWKLITDSHYGGFAKVNPRLRAFKDEFEAKHAIELDMVYNAKMMYRIFELIRENVFESNVKILAIHTGGLQGNRSGLASAL